MKNFYVLFLSLIFLASCGTKKQIAQSIASGNFNKAIDLAIKKLSKKKNTKSSDDYVLLLEEAYAKANEKDLREIERLKKEPYPEKWEKIYRLYAGIMDRQDKVRPLLPLRITSQNRNAHFDMTDYMKPLREARNRMVEVKYNQALAEMRKRTRTGYRTAYDLLEEIDRYYPDYKDVRQRMETCRQNGIAYVGVKIENKTDKIIPKKLQNELLDFEGNRANNFWTVYEPAGKDSLQYDYLIKLTFTDIQVSPEKEQEKIIDQERQIQDGWNYVRDQNGNIVRDSTGKAIRTPRYITVRARVHQYRQFKEAVVKAKMDLYGLPGLKKLASEPLQAHYVFENIYLKVQGDKRALSDELGQIINNIKKPFPSNEQMIYDAGQDIKAQFKKILNQSEFP